MRIVVNVTVAKIASEPESNEDCRALSSDGLLAVLSDGASESFDSKAWSRLLVENALALYPFQPILDVLPRAIHDYQVLHDVATMSWSRQLAYARGSFATLLACRQYPGTHRVEMTCIGDCVALLMDGAFLMRTLRYTRSIEFQTRPTLLSSRADMNDFLGSPHRNLFAPLVFDMSFYRNPRIFLMSDALAEWAIRRLENGGLEDVLSLADLDCTRFMDFVCSTRDHREMRTDDTTLMVLEL